MQRLLRLLVRVSRLKKTTISLIKCDVGSLAGHHIVLRPLFKIAKILFEIAYRNLENATAKGATNNLILNDNNDGTLLVVQPKAKYKKAAEMSCCKKVQTEKGIINVCVISEEDMGKKVIALFYWNGKEKWISKVSDLTKTLDKMGVVSADNKTEIALFVNTQFRTLKKYNEISNIGLKGFRIGKGRGKEV